MIRWLSAIALIFAFAATATAQNSTLDIQRQLASLDINPGSVDGVAGLQTRNAIFEFQYNFGFPGTGQLTPEQAKFLAKAEQFSKMTTPFIVVETREQYQSRDRLFLNQSNVSIPRTAYANGAHYLAQRGYYQHHPENLEISSTITTPLNNSAFERSQALSQHAYELAARSGDKLSSNLLLLSEYAREPETIPESLNALLDILSFAEDHPEETALLSTLTTGIVNRIHRDHFCDTHGPEIYPVLERTIRLLVASAIDGAHWTGTNQLAITCSPPERRDEYFELLVATAETVSPSAVARSPLQWGRDAFERAEEDIARENFRIAAQTIQS